ncbi:MerR family transcriptional regulator [Trinickia dabaoshanensis]|uniref:MerR family transcriptional regulator n=1 Tax=Trinickia dabaoshanensis TaxID=564714 RepID=A0A2N7VE20_9BURK|nr:MerR family transcriptional regulator [Trinickia dabaoshanensis]PMS15385.1 MerR family transcriptional regulator [Trinickia dabaoshanensis]
MTTTVEKVVLPPIPAKRYFTIGEVSELCGVKPHVLRYWEQEFTQLRPVKRRGNRRYYQHHEVLLIRRIRELLYEQGFTINGARNKLDARGAVIEDEADAKPEAHAQQEGEAALASASASQAGGNVDVGQLRKDLIGIIELLRR